MRKDSGRALVAVIIIVVIAIIGAVAYVAYTQIGPSSTSSTDSVTIPEGMAGMTVDEWDVTSYYTDLSQNFDYVLSDDNELSFTDSVLTQYGCTAGYATRGAANEDALVGSVETGLTNEEAYAKELGDASAYNSGYYYFATSPQEECSLDQSVNAHQAAAFRALAEFVDNLDTLDD